MSEQELRAEIERLGPWHHDVEVVPGVWTGIHTSGPGAPSVIRPDLAMAALVQGVFPEGLNGRSMLDCACNGGGYLFAAARHGAGRCFGFDVRDHWIDQAQFLARHVPSDGLEFATMDLAALPSLGLEPFDVTLFMGIFYHLPDPVAGLRIAADHTRELLVLNTALGSGEGNSLVLNLESDTEVMSGVHRLAWLPTDERVLREILAWCGFPHTRLHFTRRNRGYWPRVELLAARKESTFAHYDAAHPPAATSRSWWIRRLLRRARSTLSPPRRA